MRYELNDDKWTAIKPMLPNKPRGVHRVNDRRVLNGIFWVLRSTADKRDFGTHRTSIAELYQAQIPCRNRSIRRADEQWSIFFHPPARHN